VCLAACRFDAGGLGVAVAGDGGSSDSPADSPLMAALRGWRTARAQADGVAPFIVAHDSMLLDIAESRPSTIAELRRVKGMGPTKLERYGDELLATMSQVALDEPG
jgi:superfamily II DNA helicase RecQ